MDAEQITRKILKAFEKFHTKGVEMKDKTIRYVNSDTAKIEIYMVETTKGSGSFDDVAFVLYDKNEFVKYVSVQDDILDILMDPFNKVGIAKHFILNFLITYATNKNYEPDESTISIFRHGENNLKVIFSTKSGKMHEITVDEIFDVAKMLG